MEERESKAKHLQTVAGVQPVAYWFSSLLWDTLNYQLPLWITVGMMFIFDIKVLTTSDNNLFTGVLALLILYGPAAAGFAYCTSFMFKSPTLCNVVLIISSFIISLGGSITALILYLILSFGEAPRVKLANLIVLNVLRFFPAFNLAKGLLFALNISFISLITGEPEISALSFDVLLVELIYLAWQGVGYTLLAIFLDVWTTNPSAMSCFGAIASFMNGNSSHCIPDDSDVSAEETRVLEGSASNDLIVLQRLSKTYPNGKVAVKNMSLGIPPGECFGLLGINGKNIIICFLLSNHVPKVLEKQPAWGCSLLNFLLVLEMPPLLVTALFGNPRRSDAA